MKRATFLAALAALMMTVWGCERQETPQVAPEQKPAVEAQKPMTPEEKTALPVVEEKIDKATAEEAAALKSTPPASPEASGPPATETKTEAPVPAPQPKAETAPAKAEAPGPVPPQTVVYEASNGKVTFEHQAHAGQLGCSSCHPTDPPAKIAIDKEKAHQMCKGCHQEKGAGPTQCGGCHKKG